MLLLDGMTTAVTSPILVILMSPKVNTFPTHTLTPTKRNQPGTMGAHGFVRCGVGSRNRLLALGVLGNFHCWATFIQAVLLLALPYLTLFTAVCHRSLPALGVNWELEVVSQYAASNGRRRARP